MKELLIVLGMWLFCLSLYCGISFAIGAWLWPYTINTWLVYADKPPQIEWWMGGLFGLVPGVGHSSIMCAAITFVAMLFLGG